MRLARYLILCLVPLFAALSSIGNLSAQTTPTAVQCGQILDSEFLRGGDEGIQEYSLSLAPGDRLSVSGDTVGNYLKSAIAVFAPTTGRVADTGGTYGPFSGVYDEPSTQTDVLSERGIYTIRVKSNGPGLYTLYIGCTLRDGTVISPGDIVAPATPVPPTAIPTISPESSAFIGFSGLQPVDFSQVAFPKLPVSTPFEGEIAPTGNQILGFKFDANANDAFELNLNRPSGNLILGVVILSPDSEMIFQTCLVTSTTLNTRFILPDTGTYTIGVFRVDLAPPAAPETTAFQVQGAIVS